MKTKVLVIALTLIFISPAVVSAGPHYVSGKVTSLKGSGSDPAIRVGNNLVPEKCNGGTYGWLYFSGTPQERQWTYSTALAMAVAGKSVSVYTNSDGQTCRIINIQVTTGL